jgi:hypothetical protein
MQRHTVKAGSARAVLVTLAMGLCFAAAITSIATAAPRVFARVGYAQVHRACALPTPGLASCFALVRTPVSATASAQARAAARPFVLGDGAASAGPAGGLTPAQLASAYAFNPIGAAGQTVAIVDAYDDPEIEGDLATFDSYYGLPGCTSANGCFTKVGQTGSTLSLPAADESGWSVEIALDVETVRAACHSCKILLVEANNSSITNLASAVDEAVGLGATEVSNSYGGPEAVVEEAAYDHPAVVITAATGDFGYDDWSNINEEEEAPERPNIPAAFPSVVAVGGTTLVLNEDGTRAGESVWNGNGPGDESEFAEGVTGGGCSTLFTAQLWQQDAPGFGSSGCDGKRLDADVSADADPYTGFDVYDSYKCSEGCPHSTVGGGWITVGGTSLSAPLIASLYGLAGGSSGVPYPALTLYGHLSDPTDFYDVTEGANGFCGGEGVSQCSTKFCSELGEPGCGGPNAFFGRVDCEGTTACNAAVGFDGPTGVGTPNGLGGFRPLLPTAAITPPDSPKAGVAADFSAASSKDPYPGGLVDSYSWSWGDGTADGTGVSPTHTFSAPGEYTVTLTVTDNYGLSSLANSTLHVANRTTKEIEEEEAAAKKKAEEEAAAKKKAEEEAAKERQGVKGFKSQLAVSLPDAQLTGLTLQVGASGAVVAKVSCPVGETTCVGTVTLRTLRAVSASASPALRRHAILAIGSFSVPGGSTKVVTLRLSAQARKLLGSLHKLRAQATVRAHDATGATHTSAQIVLLHMGRQSRG